MKLLFEGAPYPVILISSNSSFSKISYLVEWEDPVDVCLPILQFQIKYRRVKALFIHDLDK